MADYDEQESLESGDTKEPDLQKIVEEIEQANVDASAYMHRMLNCKGWWLCEWPNQTIDGRKWALSDADVDRVFPWNGCCFSLDTEVLTEHGWRKISEVAEGEGVYSRSEDGMAEYRPVVAKTRNFSKFAVEMKGKSIDLFVTPNHKILINHKRSGKQDFVPALTFTERYVSGLIPLTSRWNGESPLEICGLPSRSYARLLGWYVSEGSINNGNTVGIAQSRKKQSHCSVLENDIKEAGCTFNYSGNTYWIRSSTLPSEFREQVQRLGTAKEKYIPDSALNLSSELLEELLDTLLLGDGSKRPNGHRIFYTTSRRLADQVQILAQKTGQRARIGIRFPRNTIIRGRSILALSCQPVYEVSINRKTVVQTNKLVCRLIETESEQEFACVNVPPHHTLYVRRNGIAVWCGNSDSRLRIVSTLVDEHVRLSLQAFWSAKVQTKSIRPFISARESNVLQQMLNWTVYTKMKRELLNELPLAFAWRWGNGLSFIGVEWEQQRELAYVPISLDMLVRLTQQLGLPDISQQIMDPDRAFDDDLITVLQAISPVLPKGEGRKILTELRNTGASQIPIASFRVNKPKWTALRPFVDLWFPSETSDIQQARWVARRELVSETELTDRIVTDGYDDDFVAEALEHKGVFSGIVPYNTNQLTALGSDRDLVELFHFRSRYLDNDVPCLYKTILCVAVNKGLNGKPLYAVHRKDEYDHQLYPFVALRRSKTFRPLLSSTGIAEEAYTDENDVKRQQDGLNDRTDLIHQPPMIVPTLRAQAVSQNYGPRSIMTSMRPEAIQFPPLPPMDQTPVLVMQFVQMRLDRRYPTAGEAVDPNMKQLYWQQLGTDILGELELALEQTMQLGQQYWTQEDVQQVTGSQDWGYTRAQIQMQATVSATVDMTLIDKEVAKSKLEMLAQLLPFKDAGGIVFNAAANVVDTDLADMLTEDQMSPTAMKKEKDDEYAAWGQILSGLVPQKPMMANNQLRLQTIGQEIMTQPNVAAILQQDQMKQKIAQDRVEFFQNQIQQYQVNPQIGRALSTQPFTGGAPQLTNAQT